ncbi:MULTISPECIES: muconate/chloromuconate family cycloisomerase [Sphingobium]|jgi:muconate cycloisomerase|uniref:muconate/chloromuconate family cycloisomerase n=1 Tax=Sphingobium TaxID=165695 RepID=UPI0020A2D830|nr:muconate/chloromuconate family cycloisomerase [Sphingobium sp. RSMS]UXC93287.1 muconate/chloromuconate family cycloisomerase [Sphingobium sp. RSMS]
MASSITIDSVEAFILDVPTIRPHVLSVATMRSQAMVIVRLVCSDGVEGIGEGTTIGGLSYGAESPEGIKLAVDTYFAPVLTGADATRPAAIMARLRREIAANHFARNAVETALLDAQGKRLGVPVSELLGGRVRDRLPVLWTLASGNTARDIEEAEAMLASRRHDAFKLKIGKRPLEADVAHVAAIKKALGDRASVRVDVNQAWSEVTAKRGLAMLADAGVDLVEQPIRASSLSGMARLTAMGRLAVMADEALYGPETGFAYAAAGAADVFAIKIAQAGGLTAARGLAAIAEAAGVALYGGTMLEGGVGTVASAQLFATFADLAFGTELFGPLLLTEEVLAQPLDYSDYSLAVPDGPGLGIALNPDAVAAFRRDAPARTTVLLSGQAKG